MKEEHTVYRVYDWEGNVIKKIIPSQMIEGEYNFREGFVKQDFSDILYVRDNIGVFYSEEPDVYGVCQMDSGECRVIYE